MKPCKHQTPQEGCRICHLASTDPRYQKLWGEVLPGRVDRWYLLNLKRRPDRLEAATRQLDREGIEFVRMEAVDGRLLPLPKDETKGSGAYGCRLGHLRILEQAIQDNLNVVGVFEDDIVLVEGFGEKLQGALQAVPGDWEMLYCGTQHRKPYKPAGPGIVRCVDCHRTHSYIVRGAAIRKLYGIWSNEHGHIDHILGKHFATLKAYAVEPQIAGQGESKSDISGKSDKERWWASKQQVTTQAVKPCGGCKAAQTRRLLQEARKHGFK